MVLAGSGINMGTLILPPLLMAIGIAYAIHVVSRYYAELRAGRVRAPRSSQATVEHMRLPVAVAWLTTVVGCATLIFNPIQAIRDFGIYSVVGIDGDLRRLGAVHSRRAHAAARSARDARPRRTERRARGARRSARSAAGRWRTGAWCWSAGWCCVAVSLWGASRIRIETDYLEFFSPESVFRRDNDRIAAALGGTQPIYVTLDGDGRGRDEAARDAGGDPRPAAVHRRATGRRPTASRSPTTSRSCRARSTPSAAAACRPSRRDVDQLLLFVDPADIAPVVARDYSRANIIVRTRAVGLGGGRRAASSGSRSTRARACRAASTAHVTGTVVLLNRSADDLARGQVFGLWQVLVDAVRDHVADLPVAARRAAVAGAERPPDHRAVRPHGLDRASRSTSRPA